MDKQKISELYDKHYKKIFFLPIIVLIISIAIIFNFYAANHDFVHRDLSLTGGTSITVLTNVSSNEIQQALVDKIPDVETRYLLDSNGVQNQVIIMTTQKPEQITPIIESYLGYSLDSTNSNIEFTGSSLSENFYKQFGATILFAFFSMAAVVFIIFAKGWKVKTLSLVLTLLLGWFLGKMAFTIAPLLSITILAIFVIFITVLYFKYSIPSFAVMFCAFADIIMTLAAVDLLGMRIAGAGIVAFLMLIGYSVDTDILLTTRVLKRKDTSVNHEIFGAFKTGMTMTLTAIAAIAVALAFVHHFGTVLNQMFIILLIGLGFDIFNTWVTNTSLIKWFIEHKAQ